MDNVHDACPDDKTVVDLETPSKGESNFAMTVNPDSVSNGDANDFPDGGLRAWLIVFGVFCANFASVGFVDSWGVFQSYYEKTLLESSSVSNIAWIGSVQRALCFLLTIAAGRLFDLGHFKTPFFLASCVEVVATFLIEKCKVYWHFLLCQGFAIGLASGTLLGSVYALLSQWFKRRTGIALGIFACGASVAGIVFPAVFQTLLGKIGFQWTTRVFGFLIMFALSIANLTLHRRLPPRNVPGGIWNIGILKSLPYTSYVIASFVGILGHYAVPTYISVSASERGVENSFIFYLISIMNACKIVGDLFGGFLAVKFGAINTITPFALAAGIVTYIWPFVRGKTGYIAIAVLYGISTGVATSVREAPVMALGSTGDVGRRTGLFLNVVAIGALVCSPISGAIYETTGGYSAVGFYAGTVLIMSVCTMWVSKRLALGRFCGKF